MTYAILINEQQRRLLHIILKESAEHIMSGEDTPFNDEEEEEILCLEDLFNPEGSVGPLKTEGLNSFVL